MTTGREREKVDGNLMAEDVYGILCGEKYAVFPTGRFPGSPSREVRIAGGSRWDGLLWERVAVVVISSLSGQDGLTRARVVLALQGAFRGSPWEGRVTWGA